MRDLVLKKQIVGCVDVVDRRRLGESDTSSNVGAIVATTRGQVLEIHVFVSPTRTWTPEDDVPYDSLQLVFHPESHGFTDDNLQRLAKSTVWHPQDIFIIT